MSPAVVGLAVAWGALAGAVVGAVAGRSTTRRRARALGGHGSSRTRERAWHRVLARVGPLREVRSLVERFRATRRARADAGRLERHLPVALDLLAVAVGAGLTPYLALEHTLQWAPAPVAQPLGEVLGLVRLGVPFAEALDDVGRRVAGLRTLTAVLAASARTGAPATEPLSRLAADGRADFRRRAAERARALSVRLLVPLVFLVLPAFVLLVVAPTLITGLGSLLG